MPQYGASAIAVYAEHEFPGIAALELADRVKVVVPSKYTVGGYTKGIRLDRFDELILVRDGAVAVICNIQNEPQVLFKTVTFLFR